MYGLVRQAPYLFLGISSGTGERESTRDHNWFKLGFAEVSGENAPEAKHRKRLSNSNRRIGRGRDDLPKERLPTAIVSEVSYLFAARGIMLKGHSLTYVKNRIGFSAD